MWARRVALVVALKVLTNASTGSAIRQMGSQHRVVPSLTRVLAGSAALDRFVGWTPYATQTHVSTGSDMSVQKTVQHCVQPPVLQIVRTLHVLFLSLVHSDAMSGMLM